MHEASRTLGAVGRLPREEIQTDRPRHSYLMLVRNHLNLMLYGAPSLKTLVVWGIVT